MRYTEKETLSVTALDQDGHPTAMPQGVPSWSLSDSSLASISPMQDGLSAVLVGKAPGSLSVTVSLGTISGSLSVSIDPGVPVKLQISAGTPSPQ